VSVILGQSWSPSAGIRLEGTALEVVTSTQSLSVLAGPGAGKTELLAQRANFFLTTGSCVPPRRILAIAFKVDAARNLADRVAARCDASFSSRFESLTLHAFAKRILDQFREALPSEERPTPDYNIFSPTAAICNQFQQSVVAEIPSVMNYNNQSLNELVRSESHGGLFPEQDGREVVRKAWWRYCIPSSGRSSLTFDMVMLLAIRILRSRPTILGALRQTYSHVFLDEFQDITTLQYDLIKAAFSGSGAVVTAVGDTNQAIMKWAGALPDIFKRLEADFGASPKRLQFNHRSNRAIVDLINSVATLFESHPVPTEAARTNDPVPDGAVEGWSFETRDAEGRYLANFIKQELEPRRPEDFVILARQRIGDVEDRLRPHFMSCGLRLRNEARQVAGVEIQDLVKEPAFRFVLATLKLAVGVRTGNPFQTCRDFIAQLEGHDINTDRGSLASLNSVRKAADELAPLVGGGGPSAATGAALVNQILDDHRRDQFARAYLDYRNAGQLSKVIGALVEFYDECADGQSSWEACIDLIEGKGVVRLMTIHKSKGLEYDTVFFVELNDDAFWNRNGENANLFLVALSRARERVKFSFCRDSGGFENVEEFLRCLDEAGVPFIEK
jgi:superfamily I DNA/RNA helicase